MPNDSTVKTTRRVAKNAIAQIVRMGATLISKLLIVIVIARSQGVEQVGDFSFVMTFTLTLGFLNNMGLTMLLVREIAQKRERVHEYVENSLTLGVVFGILSVGAMGLTATLLGYGDQLVMAIVLSAIAMMLDTLGNLYVAAFSGYERMELGALAIVIQEFAFLVVGGIVLFLRLPFLWLFVIYILSRFISLIASAQIYWRLWGKAPRLGLDWSLMKTLGRKTLPFAVNIALSPVFARIDVLMLSYIKGNVAVGYYEVSSTLFYRLNVLARFYNLAMLPLVANQYPVIKEGVVSYVRQALKYQTMIGALITAVSLVLGGQVILAVYGPDFNLSVPAFQVLTAAIVLRFVDNTMAITLTAINLETRRAIATASMAAFNVIVNLFAIPRYGIMGAAVSSVLTEIGFFVLLYTFVRTRLPNPFNLEMLVRPFLAALLTAGALLVVRVWPLWTTLPLGVVVYAALALPLRVVTPKELGFLLTASKVAHRIPRRLQRALYLTPPE
jgi:O-antigen/teichoic acid export membrane protein